MKSILICAECGCPFARIEEGKLVIVSHHHGQKHTSRVDISSLNQLVANNLPDDATTLDKLE